MKGYRFYEEFETNAKKRKRISGGNVVALLLDERGRPYWNGTTYDCISAVYSHPNSGVASTGASPDYLAKNCRRISEEDARRIHPVLFRWLDSD
jgi:hypothetical protein